MKNLVLKNLKTVLMETFKMEQLDLDRIATALERIAEKLDHLHIDAIDHNHVEGDVNTHAKTW